jgi:hypothetical protein
MVASLYHPPEDPSHCAVRWGDQKTAASRAVGVLLDALRMGMHLRLSSPDISAAVIIVDS